MSRLALLCAVAVLGAWADDAVTEEAVTEEAVTEEEATPVFTPAKAPKNAAFFDDFQSGAGKWTLINNEVYSGEFKVQDAFDGSTDSGLTVTQPAQKYGAYAKFESAFKTDEDMVIQYDVTFRDGLECGGAYIKLLRDDADWDGELTGETPYTIMFGPDRCGSTNKVHFIFQYKNPTTGKWNEHHLTNPPSAKTDSDSHLYALAIRKDNSFSLYIDSEERKKGNLLSSTDFTPPLIPPQKVDDPEDSKPEDWVDDAQIADPNVSKPDDWDEDAPFQMEDGDASQPDDWLEDEELLVPDPEAEMPEDWDEEDDGEWEAPLIDNQKCTSGKCGKWTRPKINNPAYKGKWNAPMIDNPDYKGLWAPRKIANPEFFEEENPQLTPMSAVAIEIWTMQKDIQFDNFYIGHDSSEAYAYGEHTWNYKKKVEDLNKPPVPGVIERILDFVSPIIEDLTSFEFKGKNSPWTLPILITLLVGLFTIISCACCGFCADEETYHPQTKDGLGEEEDKPAKAKAQTPSAAATPAAKTPSSQASREPAPKTPVEAPAKEPEAPSVKEPKTPPAEPVKEPAAPAEPESAPKATETAPAEPVQEPAAAPAVKEPEPAPEPPKVSEPVKKKKRNRRRKTKKAD